MSVMIVEDEPLHQKLYETWLSLANIPVIIVPDPRSVQASIAEHHPDIVIVDIKLPYMDGIELIRLLRANPNFRSLPILAVTVLAFQEQGERCLLAGADAYMQKPIGRQELFRAIQGLRA